MVAAFFGRAGASAGRREKRQRHAPIGLRHLVRMTVPDGSKTVTE